MKKDDAVGELSRILEKLGAGGGDALEGAISATVRALKAGHKVLVFGNGGSAAEAQHFAAELVNRFLKERRAIPAIALTTDTSALTAIANDRSFDQVFTRQIEAIGEKGDVAIALTTSGNSPNIIEGLKAARAKGMLTIALTGEGAGKLASTLAMTGEGAGKLASMQAITGERGGKLTSASAQAVDGTGKVASTPTQVVDGTGKVASTPAVMGEGSGKVASTLAMTGEGAGKLAGLADFLLVVPSKSTPRIQEAHLLILHIMAEEIETGLY